MQRVFKPTLPFALATLGFGLMPHAAHAASEQQLLVDRATLAVQGIFVDASDDSRATRYLSRARAVMVCPSLFRMSILFGGAGGGCVLLARDAKGSWSDPAFYTLSTASLGLQLGIESSQMVFFIMSDRGLQALLDSQFKFDAGASASFANIGSGIQTSSAGESNTDILALQKSSGLYAGASLGGTKLTVNSAANRAYYGHLVGPESIVINMRVNNSGADPLRRVLMVYSQNSGAKAVGRGSADSMRSAKPKRQPIDDTPLDLESNNNPRSTYRDAGRGAVRTQNLPARHHR